MQDLLRGKRHMQRFFAAGEHADLAAVVGGAAQAGGQERLLFAQVGAEHQNGTGIAQVFNALAEPLRAFQAALQTASEAA